MKKSIDSKLKDGIDFRKFRVRWEVVERYFKWFNSEEYEEVLYDQTPREKEEIVSWLSSLINDPSSRYWFVYKSGEPVGHVALRGIDMEKGHAEVGSFILDKRHRSGKLMKQAVEFLIEQAREMGVRLLTADFVDEYQPQIKPFIAAGFTRTPGAPHYLALRLWNSCSGLGKSEVKQGKIFMI